MNPNKRTAMRAATLTLIAAALAACGGGDEANRGHLDSSTEKATLPKAAIDAAVAATAGLGSLIGGSSKCDVTLSRLDYRTVGPAGNAERATAGLAVPSNCTGPFPILVYHHGTTVEKAYTASNPANGEAQFQMSLFAAQGYVVVMPDYLGYGGSTLDYTPYLHAENTAAVSIDALRAAKKALADRAVATTGKLFLAGVSQGGHATLATHRAIERDLAGEFTVTASAPVSGPYDLSSTFLSTLDNPGIGATVYAPMVVVGFQKAYGGVYSRPEDVFQAPWVTGIESLLPGALSTTQLFVQGKLPLALTGTGGLLTSSFVSSFKASADFPARKLAAQQNVYDWKPKVPVMLCSGARDPVVTFQNTITAAASFASKGAAVTPVDVEQVPQFQPVIAAQVAAAPDLSTYHGGIVPPLCLALAKSQLFDPLK